MDRVVGAVVVGTVVLGIDLELVLAGLITLGVVDVVVEVFTHTYTHILYYTHIIHIYYTHTHILYTHTGGQIKRELVITESI